MRLNTFVIIIIVILGLGSVYFFMRQPPKSEFKQSQIDNEAIIKLPTPKQDSDISIEEALIKRRSTRDYKPDPLTIQEVSQLLWATQGITDKKGFRTAPSAGALYPLEVYVVVGDVKNLIDGVYKYNPTQHELLRVLNGNKRSELAKAALDQTWVKEAAIDIVIAAVYERTTVKYGDRGVRYVHMEVGHAAQNLCLQASALDLGIVTVGAFYDNQVKTVLSLPDKEMPLYIIPVGRK
jgi:SagB-type dehydrogenase family enzyme